MPGSTRTPSGACIAARMLNVCVVGSATCAISRISTGNSIPGAPLSSAIIDTMSAVRMSAAITDSGTSTRMSICSTSCNRTTGSLARTFCPSSTNRCAITPSYGARSVQSCNCIFASTTRPSSPRTSASRAVMSSSRPIVPFSTISLADSKSSSATRYAVSICSNSARGITRVCTSPAARFNSVRALASRASAARTCDSRRRRSSGRSPASSAASAARD